MRERGRERERERENSWSTKKRGSKEGKHLITFDQVTRLG